MLLQSIYAITGSFTQCTLSASSCASSEVRDAFPTVKSSVCWLEGQQEGQGRIICFEEWMWGFQSGFEGLPCSI